jgi:TPR repeat protein
VVLLAALAGAGWWTYGYLDNTDGRRSQAATAAGKNLASTPSDTQNRTPNETSNETPNKTLNSSPNDNPSTTPPLNNASPPLDAAASQAPAPPAVPATPSDNLKTGPDSSSKDAAAEAKPAVKTSPAIPRVALGDKSAQTPKSHVAPARPSKPPEAAAADTGTADFQKGEAYLYGRGAPENCDQAVKYLKSASAKSSAKAKSAFGTMYATGHCVARDLPTSYLWFAMALREDPNNQILEKDLSAIWNQMTPPERQLATRMKQ